MRVVSFGLTVGRLEFLETAVPVYKVKILDSMWIKCMSVDVRIPTTNYLRPPFLNYKTTYFIYLCIPLYTYTGLIKHPVIPVLVDPRGQVCKSDYL